MRRREKTHANWSEPLTHLKSVKLIGLIFIAFLSACRGLPPKVDLKLWAGDSSVVFDRSYRADWNTEYRGGITRAQSGESIACDDVRIEEYVCMTYEDLKKIMDAMWSCQKWPAQVAKMSNTEANKAIQIYGDVSSRATEIQEKKRRRR